MANESGKQIDPPPNIISEFDWHWRSWLNRVYEKLRGPLWEDLLSPLAEGGVGQGAPGGPTVVNSGPYKAYTFVAGDSINVAFHIPHNIKPGSKMYPHIHWTTNGTNTGAQVWRVHHQIAKGHNQEAFPTATTIDLPSAAASGIAWQHMITECTDEQAIDAPEPDTLMLMSIELETKGSSDTVFGLYADLHFEIDRFGTPRKNPRDPSGNLIGFYEYGKK